MKPTIIKTLGTTYIINDPNQIPNEQRIAEKDARIAELEKAQNITIRTTNTSHTGVR